ncbi:MAG: efflux RND transporter periplasmic adaptor subunit [Lachnospiraceae bacterium]|nr:efflux RND transporter periplasmic adaptor subunit [Lachnospiraceae bacterium]
MKIRTALISVALTGALIAGGVYTAYHTIGKAAPVEVTPVANVALDASSFSDGITSEGIVTSRVSQNITLDAEYSIAEIYVSAGDTVTEGTALFSYEMTRQELMLKIEQIHLQQEELRLKGYNKQLAKYTGTTTTASLKDTSSVRTTSSSVYEVYANDAILPDDDDTYETENSTEPAADRSGSGIEGSAGTDSENGDSDHSVLVIEDIETIEPDADTAETIRAAVTGFEALMSELAAFLNDFEEDVTSDDIEEALLTAAEFYYGTLAGEFTEETVDGDVTVTYILKDSVTGLLDEDELSTLESCAVLMEHVCAYYVDLLITEAAAQDDPLAAAQKARDAYEALSSTAKEYVTQLDMLESLENTATESETETAPAKSETETETPSAEDTGIAANVSTFLLMADELLMETASPSESDYQNAIAFYQMYLSVPRAEIAGEDPYMENYILSDETLCYLSGIEDGSSLSAALEEAYQSVCLAYVKFAAASLNPEELTWEELNYAINVYASLGSTWAVLLSEESPSVLDTLKAYSIALGIRDLDETSDSFLADLQNLYEQYLALDAEQMLLVWNADTLLTLMFSHGLLNSDTAYENESEFSWDDWGDSSYDYGYSSENGVTEEEIETLQETIKEQELTVREKELKVSNAQRVVDKKTVKSSVTGTVLSIGDLSGIPEDDSDYFVKIISTEGLYAKGYVSEQELDSIAVGDIVTGTASYADASFTAVIKEISDYPDTGYQTNTGDSSLAYYAFYALIDDPVDVESGTYVELTIAQQTEASGSSIGLASCFVQKDSMGNFYVYVQDSNGLLEQRFVTVGKNWYTAYYEITSGLTLEDLIAFPYGNNVTIGADTTEVDELSALIE